MAFRVRLDFKRIVIDDIFRDHDVRILGGMKVAISLIDQESDHTAHQDELQGLKYWYISCDSDSCFVSVGRDDELHVLNGDPGPDYAPDIFHITKIEGTDRYTITLPAIITRGDEKPYKLAVDKNADGNWILTHKNKTEDSYDWCFKFSEKEGHHALKWCGTPKIESGHAGYIKRDDNRLYLDIISEREEPHSEHYIHRFSSA